MKSIIVSGQAEIMLNEDIYNIGIVTHGYNHLPFSVKGLKVKNNKKIVVDCYLGSSVE